MFRKGQLTTGALKALGGGLLALSITFMSCKFDWNTQSSVDIIINVFIIVLSINVINLLDLRPGRAGKAFLFLSMIILLFADWSYSILPLSLIIGSLLVYLYWDLKSYVMMGDTGSNALGVVIGITAIFGIR
ncbi:hypothetical protein M1M96_01985 [Peptococcaceae bacterium]|nr:hypothetical protein [Peptococcaceae bacterium]MCL0043837.1 hypothetical protein [Peptococcaceae bacterium]